MFVEARADGGVWMASVPRQSDGRRAVVVHNSSVGGNGVVVVDGRGALFIDSQRKVVAGGVRATCVGAGGLMR